MAQETLDTEVNQDVQIDNDNKSIRTALNLISSNFSAKNQHDDEMQAIQDLFEDTFIIEDPRSPRRLNSHILYQALWRTANRMKFLDFMVHGEGSTRVKEKIVTAGVSTVMEVGGLINIFRGKMGGFFNMLNYGDTFFMFGPNPDKRSNMPIAFQPLSHTNIFVDNNAVGIRVGDRRSAYRMCPIFNYTFNQFGAEYPDFVKKVGVGRISRKDVLQDQEKTFSQHVERQPENEIEVGCFFDINNEPTYTKFAGSGHTIIQELKGNDYPWFLDGEPYIPVSQWAAIPSSEGFFNYGIGHIAYKLTIIARQLLNMQVGHTFDNVHPTELVSVPQGKEAEFFGKMKTADLLRAAGKRAFVAMAYDPNNPNASAVSSQTLQTQGLFNEFDAVWNVLTRELARFGINLDESSRTGEVTATQILSEEENANAWVKQVMEYNAGEAKFIVDATMQNIKQFVSPRSKAPLNLTTKIPVPREVQSTGQEGEVVTEQVEGEARADTVTMGDVKQEISARRYWSVVNSRTGAIPSNLLLQAKIARVFPLAAPGSKAHRELLGMQSQVNDFDFAGEDFLPQQPQAPQGAPGGEIEPPAPSGTDRQTFLPRLSEQVAAL